MSENTSAPGAAPASAPPANPNSAPAAAPTDWVAGIPDEGVRSWVTAKGFKDPASLAQSALNLEKLTGDLNSVVRLPKDDKPESWAPVYDKLGRPQKAEDYKLPVPEGHPDTFAKTAAGWMHEAGLNTRQAQALAAKWNEFAGQQATVQAAAANERAKTEIQALKNEWAGDFDARMALVDRAASAFGLDEAAVTKLRDSLGAATTAKFLHNIGLKLGVDDGFVAGNTPNGGGFMTPERARAEIQNLRADRAFAEQFNSQDPVVRKDARDRMDRLHKMAYPG